MERLGDLRDQLRAGLSEKAPDQEPAGLSLPELAERIKALRASVTVEAAPERTVRKSVRAERPVTARIRERMVEQPVAAVEEAVEPQAVVAAESAHAAEIIPMPEPVKPEYRQAVTRRRQEKAEQLRLF